MTDPESTAPTVGPAPDDRLDADAIIRSISARQHGVVAREQLICAGLPAHVVAYRVKRGRVRRLYRGVYQVGPVTGRRWREVAAVLACGEGSVVSHDSSVAVWGLSGRPDGLARMHVSSTSGREPGRDVRVHRVSVPADERTCHDDVPVTTVPRTLLDLAAVATAADLEQVLARADRQGLVDAGALELLLRRHAGRAGTLRLRAVLGAAAPPALTRSEAESRFLGMVRRARLGTPAANVAVRGHEVDFLWRTECLVVEIDGFEFHSSRAAFERDRRRDADLTAAGLRVLRFTWRQLDREPEMLLTRLAQALVR